MNLITLALALLVSSPQDPEALVRELGSDEPAARERAARELAKRGTAATEALRKAAGSSDAEVAGRAREILLGIRAARFSSLKIDRTFSLQAGFGRADHFRVTPDGKHAVGHDLEHVRVWTVPEGRVVSEWRAHPRGARDLALSPDGTRVLTWAYDGLALWELPSGRLVRRYDTLSHLPKSFAASPDGKRIAWATSEGVEWVEAETGKVVWVAGAANGELRTPVAVAVSPDGGRVASVGANSRTVELREGRTGALVLSLDAPSTGFRSRVSFTPDGASVVVSNWDQGKAWRFSASTGAKEAEAAEDEFHALAGGTARFKVVHPLDEKAYEGRVLIRPPKKPFGDSPEQWAATADEKHVLVRTLNGRRILVFDAKTGEPLREIGEGASTFAVGAEGVLVGTRKGAVALHDLEGKELRRVAGGEGIVSRVAFAGAGRAVWVDGAHVLRCSELEGGKELWRKEYFALGWSSDALLPDGLHAVGDLDEQGTGRRHLIRWELTTGREVGRYAKFDGYLAGVAASPDGGLIAASTRDGPLAVWETVSRKKLWEWKPGKNARWLQFSPDGESLFAGDDEGRVARTAARTGEVEKVYAEKGDRVLQGALSADGNRLAAASDAVSLRVFDVASGTLLQSWKEARYGGVAFLEGGAKVISGGPVVVADVASGAIAARVEGPKPIRHVGLDPSRGTLGVLFEGGAFVAVELESGRRTWETRAPDRAFGFALGPDAGSVVFFREHGHEPQSFRRGEDRPVAKLEKMAAIGFDAARGRLFTAGSLDVQARDFLTFGVKEEAAVAAVEVVRGYPGSPFLYARIGEELVRLAPSTLLPVGPVCPLRRHMSWDLDPAGEILMVDGELRDAITGRVRGRLDARPIQGMSFVLFGAAGERIVAVTAEGSVVILAPRD